MPAARAAQAELLPRYTAVVYRYLLGAVRDLDLSANRLGPVAVRLLASSAGVRGLRALDLSGNPVGDAGAVAYALERALGLADAPSS